MKEFELNVCSYQTPADHGDQGVNDVPHICIDSGQACSRIINTPLKTLTTNLQGVSYKGGSHAFSIPPINFEGFLPLKPSTP